MVTVGEAEKQEYAAKFNRILGNKMGRPMSIPKSNAALNSLVKDDVKAKAARDYLVSKGKNTRSTSSRIKPSKSLTKEQKEKVAAALTKNLSAEKQDLPWWKDALKVVQKPLEVLDVPRGYVASGVKEISDTIETSRVGKGLYDIMGYDPAKEGRTPSKGSFSDFLKQGKDHIGFGDIWAQARGPEDKNKWLDRAVGLAGDVALDPVNYIGGEALTVGAKALKSGARFTGKEAVEATGRAAVRDTLDNSVRKGVQHVLPDIDITDLDELVSAAHKISDDITVEIGGGSRRGAMKGVGEVAPTVGHRIREAVRNKILEPHMERVAQFEKALADDSIKKPAVARLIQKSAKESPYFNAYRNASHEVTRVGGSLAEAQRAGMEAMTALTKDYTDQFFAVFMKEQEDALRKLPVLRWAGKDIAEFPRLGEAVDKAGKAIKGSKLVEKYHPGPVGKAFRYAANITGKASLVGQRVKAAGTLDFEKFEKVVHTIAAGTTREERRLIHRAIEKELPLDGKLGEIKEQAMALYDEIWNTEIAEGIRPQGATQARNYVYNRVKGRKNEKLVKMLEGRKSSVKANKRLTKEFTSEELKRQGFNVEDDFVNALLHRKMKSNRQVTRSAFLQDLVSMYGTKSMISPEQASKEGLSHVNETIKGVPGIPKKMKEGLKEGEKVYVDNKIMDMYHYFNKLISSEDSEEAKEFLSQIDWVTNKFKTMNTIYFPGFHVRNMVSDMFFGALDGVGLGRYKELIAKYPKRNTAMLEVGGKQVPYMKVVESYKKNAESGGFYPSDIPTGATVKGHTFASAAREASTKRENFGRLTHYYHALDQELTAGLKRGETYEVALENAEAAATQRVNWYKFDYNALTHVERKYARRGMPFYTYSRKAIPAVLQAMYQNPRWLNLAGHAQKALQENNPEGTAMPDFLRELSFGALPGQQDSDEPFGLTNELTPHNLLNEKLNPANLAQNLNPILQGINELNTGEDTFSGRPVNNVFDILANKSRLVGQIRTAQSDKSPIVKYANFLGIPLKQNTKAYQDMAVNQMEGKVDNKLDGLKKKYDLYDKGYNLYFTTTNDGAYLRLKKTDADKYEKQFKTLAEAEAYLKKL